VTEKQFLDLSGSGCVRAMQRDCDREGVPRFDGQSVCACGAERL